MQFKYVSVSNFIWSFIKKKLPLFALAQFFCLALTADHVLWPQVIKNIIQVLDNYHGDRAQIGDVLSEALWFAAFVWIAIELMFRGAGFMNAYIIPRLEADIRLTVFEKINSQTHKFFMENMAGSVANKVNDLVRASSEVVQTAMGVIIPIFIVFISILGLFAKMHIMFSIVLICWLVAHFGISLYFMERSKEYADIHAQKRSHITGKIVDSISNNVSIRLYARRFYELSLIKNAQQHEIDAHVDERIFFEKIKIGLGIFGFLFMGIFFTWMQLYAYKNNVINLPELVFTIQSAINMMLCAWWVSLELPRFFQGLGNVQQGLSLLKVPVDIKDIKGAKILNVEEGKIEFSKVSFKYHDNQSLFEKKNLVINPSQKIGLVGFSGSGKTSFVNLLLRYYDLDGGKILIDGQDISKVTQDSLRENISMIPQEPSLFHRTIFENIAFGKLDATEQEVISAAQKAHAHDFIMELPDGYNTIVGERGSKLSGGQRQRIAIARAILKNAPIIIMDEATSALDSATERDIQNSILNFSRNKTTIIVAHRLSTLLSMDRILVFSNGKIIEDGSHDELLAAKGHYFILWSLQSNGMIPDNIA